MQAWGQHFTCIAPDTPGFGHSDPLADPDAGIDAFADALVDLLDALRLEQVGAYGFHSGGIILATALRRHPSRFAALAIGGYAVWTRAEQESFGRDYLPPLVPRPFGEHLCWLWNRVLEQTWFFPWYATTPATRLGIAHADPAATDAVVRDMLDAGDAYRVGYGAVLQAPRDLPAPDEATPPVLITAYDGDPLQEHIDRLGTLPPAWTARKVRTPDEHRAASLAMLRAHPAPVLGPLAESTEEGFLTIDAGGFAGDVHWQGRDGKLFLHAPGEALDRRARSGIAIDLPGHGLSSDWPDAPTDPAAWTAVVEAVAVHFGCERPALPAPPAGDPALLFPDLAPDRFGMHLLRAWSIVRAGRLFDPWYSVDGAHARPFAPDDLEAEALAERHLNLLRARSARAWCAALADAASRADQAI